MGKISVIVPIYNVEQYLERCINSITNQTYKNLEIILVDDGSPDRCGDICDEYAKRDKRIKVIHKENGGLSDARNAGIEAATGDYIGFVDSDDYIREDMYEKLYDAIERNNADISICSLMYVDEMGNCIDNMNKYNPIQKGVVNSKEILFEKMVQPCCWYWVVAVTRLYSKECFEHCRFKTGKLHEDEFFMNDMLSIDYKAACISERLYCYVQRNNSIMNKGKTVKSFDQTEAFFERIEQLIGKNCPNNLICMQLERSMYLFIEIYKGCKGQSGAKDKYKELTKNYRKILRKLNFKSIPVKKRVHFCAWSISPFKAEIIMSKVHSYLIAVYRRIVLPLKVGSKSYK